jgi:hypothetical protein
VHSLVVHTGSCTFSLLRAGLNLPAALSAGLLPLLGRTRPAPGALAALADPALFSTSGPLLLAALLPLAVRCPEALRTIPGGGVAMPPTRPVL